MSSPEVARATWRSKVRCAALDAQGLCRACGKQPARPNRTRCQACAEAHGASERRSRAKWAVRITPVAEVQWCDECLAAGFHRAGCGVAV